MKSVRLLAIMLFHVAAGLCLQTEAAEVSHISGVAYVGDSETPLAGARMYLKGSYVYGKRVIVTTAKNGAFSFADPPNNAANASSGSTGPECSVLPFDLDKWEIARATDSGRTPEWERKQLLERITLPATSKWVGGKGKTFVLRVAVAPCGVASLNVRGPDGLALRNTEIELYPGDEFFAFRDNDTLRFKGKTDQDGRITMRWKPGMHRLFILARGIGFSVTGTFEVLPGKTTAVELPPFAAFATVKGKVAPKLVETSNTVSFSSHAWNHVEADIDSTGRYALHDVTPGTHYIHVRGNRQIQRHRIVAEPGQHIADIQLRAKPEAIPSANKMKTSIDVHSISSKRNAEAIASGTVTDTDGNPVEDAEVFVINKYHGGIRMYEKTLTATTDRHGKYWVSGIKMSCATIATAAYKKGHPLALGYGSLLGATVSGRSSTLSMGGLSSMPTIGATSADQASHGSNALVIASDMVIPAKGGELAVHVVLSGSPASNAIVRLVPEDWHYYFSPGWARKHGGEASKQIQLLLNPVSFVGKDGVARFEHLVPGLYSAYALNDGDRQSVGSLNQWGMDHAGDKAVGVLHGIPVAVGKQYRTSLTICRQALDVGLSVIHPNGEPVSDRSVALSWYKAASSGGRTSGRELDDSGHVTFRMESHGLWRLMTRFRDSKLGSIPVRKPPYYEGQAVVAVSSLFPDPQAVEFHAVRRMPGAIRAQLRDSKGAPIKGTIIVGGGMHGSPPEYAAATDQDGQAYLRDLRAREYSLRAYLPSRKPLPILKVTMPDSALRNLTALFAQTVHVVDGQITELELREQDVGYVRGRVNVPTNAKTSDYTIFSPGRDASPAQVVYDRETGKFIYGPVPAGELTLYLRRLVGTNGRFPIPQEHHIAVGAGDVVRVQLKPEAQEQTASDRRGTQILCGRVLLYDGSTPAYGARLLQFVPKTPSAVAGAWTTAMGTFQTHSVSYRAPGADTNNDPEGSPDRPVLVAWLPGHAGATMVDVESAETSSIEIVLPEPILLRGRVTVDGNAVSDYTTTFRVLAAYQGKGKLNGVLSVTTLCDRDGNFVLRGLTPGSYEVQAAMDDIWLSETVEVNVSRKEHDPLPLNIALPGRTTIVQLKDSEGHALPELDVALDLPAGPLREQLHASVLRTDGIGHLRVDGLGAGKHTLTLSQDQTKHEITVEPVLASDRAKVQRIVLPTSTDRK